jgi:hypothetical protein
MTKVAYNDCFGGFGLSSLAEALYLNYSGKEYNTYECPRHDPILIRVIEQLGQLASGQFAKLEISEVEGNKYLIKEYDGKETILEPEDLQWITIE